MHPLLGTLVKIYMATVKCVKKMGNLAGEVAGNQVLLAMVARDANVAL